METTRALRKWNREVFGYAQNTIKNLERELEDLQLADEKHTRQLLIQEELRTQRARLKDIYRQKSRELWLKEGDQNTKFFHLSTVIQCRRNMIDAIKDGDNWVLREEKIVEYFQQNFKELFDSNLNRLEVHFENLFSEKITERENINLLRIPIKEEIKDGDWTIHPFKSLRPDGFSGIFFRK